MKRVLILIGLILPFFATAHGIGEVYALPIPLKYYLLGAGLAVAFSFFILALFVNKSKTFGGEKFFHFNWLPKLLGLLKTAALVFLILIISSGGFGTMEPSRNFSPVFFWVYFLVGMSLLSAVVGNIWDKINPWKLITDNFQFHNATKKIPGLVGVVFLLGLYWLELVSNVSFEPRVLAGVLLVYTAISSIGAQIFKNWYQDVELFSVLFGFIGRLSYLRINDDNHSLRFVSDYKKLEGELAPWSALGVASVVLASTSFDSFTATPYWYQWLEASGFFFGSKIGPSFGLILSPLPFLLLFWLAVWLMKQITGEGHKISVLARQFVYTLIPIAFGYFMAHNFSLFVVTGKRILSLISDPFGFGWNLFGTAHQFSFDLVLGANMVWFIEISFIVLAHIFGVWYAHVLALNIFSSPKKALLSQIPMVLLMIGFTVGALWLLSLPLVV